MMYIKNGSAKTNIDHVITASLRDSLDGEVSLTLSLDASYREYVTDGTVIENDDYYFDVASYEYKTLGDTYTVYIAADHVSCRLNKAFGTGGFAMQGTPAQILAAILSGSDFTVGTVENSTVYTVAIHGNTYRKNAIIQLANLCGCEIVYSGFKIGLVKRRGSDVPYELTEENILIGIDYSRDVVNDTERYILDIGQLGGLEVGQTVNVVYHPYGIDSKTARVLSVEYNPYDKFEAVVEVGDYTPDITGEMIGQANEFNKAKWEFEANDERLLSRITDAEGSISTLEQTATSLTAQIEDAEGNISILEQTVKGFETRVSSVEGDITALEQTSSNITARIEDAEGNISTLEQTVKGIETRITNAEGDASDALATAEALVFRVSTAEGDISTLEQTANGLSLRVSTAEGNISTVSQTADKVNWLIKSGTSSSNFTMTDRAISLVAANINLTGYVTFSALSTAGQTTINGSNITTGSIDADLITTGTLNADIIGANNGIYTKFSHPLETTQVSGLKSLYFGAYKYISEESTSATSPLVFYSYNGWKFLNTHPKVVISNTTYDLISAYNIASYITFQ